MLGANKILRYKKTVSILLLIFCFALAGLTTLGLILNLTPNNIAILRTTAGVVKFELTDSITKEDNTIDKLSQKIKISGSGNKGELSGLIKITSNEVMFDYILNNQTHYFSAMDKTINKVSVATYAATNGTITISDKTGLVNFRNNVNNGNSYEGQTISLTKDINLSGEVWVPIGCDNESYFKGDFDGKGHKVSNILIKRENESQYDSVIFPENEEKNGAGFFGMLNGANISNLTLENVNIELYSHENDKKYSSCWQTTVAVGCLVGYACGNMEISKCQVLNSSIDVVSDVFWSWYTGDCSVGGLVGYVGYDWEEKQGEGYNSWAYISVSNCYVNCDITIRPDKYADFGNVGGIIGVGSYVKNVILLNNFFNGNVVINNESNDSADVVSFGGMMGFINESGGNSYTVNIQGCLIKIGNNSTFAKKENNRKIAAVWAGHKLVYNLDFPKNQFIYNRNCYVTGAGCMDWSQADIDTTGATEKKVSEL